MGAAAALPIFLGAAGGGLLGQQRRRPQPGLGALLGGLTGGLAAPLLGLGAAGAGASALIPQTSAAIATGAPAVSVPTLAAATAPSALSQAGQIGLIGSQLARNLGLGQVRPPAVGAPPQPGQFPAIPAPPPPITQAPSLQAPGATPNIQQLLQLLQQRGMF